MALSLPGTDCDKDVHENVVPLLVHVKYLRKIP
jgi:hypothetical protein